MSPQEFDLIQRIRVEDGVPRVISTTIQVIEGGEDLLSQAIRLLTELGFYEKFEENRTSQYIGYRLRKIIKGAKRYQLVLAQRKEGIYLSIPKSYLESFALELKALETVYVVEEDKYKDFDEAHANGYLSLEKQSHFFWVRPSKENEFFKISEKYKYNLILEGQTTGTFDLENLHKWINPKIAFYDLEGDSRARYIKNLTKLDQQDTYLYLKERESGVYYLDHAKYLEELSKSEACLNWEEDKLFPYMEQTFVDCNKVLEELIIYFADILLEQN